jgi:hypothetical protein
MSKSEHLQFLILMLPTFVILAAAAVSMADLALPAQDPGPQAVAVVQHAGVAGPARDECAAQ